MARKVLLCFVAIVMMLGVVLVGCAGGPRPVRVKVLIRNNDQRLQIGDYVANQLEALGFKVERQYGGGGDLAPIWLGDPHLGKWHVYTAAWLSTAVSRDEGGNFGFFYTPLGGGGEEPLWEAYQPTEEFLEVATKLWWNDFHTMPERQALFEDAVPMSMEDSVRIFLNDRASFYALRKNVAVASDAYGGIEGSWLWGHTIHFRDPATRVPVKPTGTTTMKVATMDLLIEPWNSVAGSNWAFDQMPIRATGDMGLEFDTRDGLAWPHRIVKAELTVLQGLPISLNPGHGSWLNLTTSATPIAVPPTAWADFNATAGNWIPAGAGKTAKTKTVVYYPKGTFGLPLHDGSTLDEGDFLFYAIMQFDRAKNASAVYDPAYVPEYNAFMEHFKGVEFNFNDPNYDLIVTTYDDLWYMDAELIVRGNSWFPAGNLGPWVWHNLALGWLAEKDLQLAFSKSKATAKGVEWLSLISGESLTKLQSYLTKVCDSGDSLYGFIPYPNVLGTYITQAEALARYDNLQAWKNARGHFWVAGGPYYLHSVDTGGNIVQLKRFASYPDDGNRWFFLIDPPPVTPPAHKGAWVDTLVINVETQEAAIAKLKANQLDVYANGLSDADVFEEVKTDANLHYYLSAGLFDELTFNPSHTPSDPFFPETGKLNPFAIPAVREAMNWAIDRSYIVGEIYGGMAYERYTCVGTQTGDYINRYPALFAAIEAEYAYDFDRADAAIEAAMLAIPGVTRGTDGKYYYERP